MVELSRTGVHVVASIQVVCDDTDIFVLLAHYYHYSQEGLTCELTMSGTMSGRAIVEIKATVMKHAYIATHCPCTFRV